MTRLGVPSELAAGRHAALFLITSSVSFVALVVFGTLTSIGVLSNGGAPLLLTLLPAVGAAIAIVLALLFAHRAIHPPSRTAGSCAARSGAPTGSCTPARARASTCCATATRC